jgi:hypothetical protein
MTAYIEKTEFLNIYLAYPDTPPPQRRACPPPHLECSQSQTPETGYVDSTPLPEYILNKLKQEGIDQAGAWVGLPQDNRSKMVENDAYKALTRILETVTCLTRKYYPELKRLPGKWLCTRKTSVQSWSGNATPSLGPGYIFAHSKASLDKVPLASHPRIFNLNINLLLGILVRNVFCIRSRNEYSALGLRG